MKIMLQREGINKQSIKGFTIIEALVVVAISVLLTTALITYSRTSEKQIVFFREQALMTSTIQRAKAFSLETFQPELQPLFSLITTERVCGWGIRFSSFQNPGGNRYILFKDLGYASPAGSSNFVCDPDPPQNNPAQFNPATNPPEEFEIFDLDPNSVHITAVCLNQNPKGSCSGSGSNQIDVIFIPPEPKVVFFPIQDAAEAVIQFALADGSRQTNIVISKNGQMSVIPQ